MGDFDVLSVWVCVGERERNWGREKKGGTRAFHRYRDERVTEREVKRIVKTRESEEYYVMERGESERET